MGVLYQNFPELYFMFFFFYFQKKLAYSTKGLPSAGAEKIGRFLGISRTTCQIVSGRSKFNVSLDLGLGR